MEAKMMAVEEIHAAPDNLRHSVGRLKELEASITAVGILQPLVVHKNGDGKYEIIAGHRRFAAANSLGMKEVPVVIRDDLADAAKVEAMIVENFHREDLTAIEQAEGLFRLEGLGLDRATIADKTGLSKRLVADRIKLLDLPKNAQKAIHSGQLSIDAGLELAKEAEDQELVASVVDTLLTGKGRSDVGFHLGEAKRKREFVDQFAKLSAKADQLREKGVEVMVGERSADYYGSVDLPGGWRLVVKEGAYGSGLQIDAKAHAKEECAVFVLVAPHNYTGPSFEQYCKKASRHTFTGPSELKVAKAEEAAKLKAKSTADNRKEREANAAKTARYRAALATKPSRSLTASFAIAGFIEKIWSDSVKDACKLLDIEPGQTSWGAKDFQTPFREYAAKNPDRAVLALVLVDRDPLKRVDPGWLGQESYEALLSLIPEEVAGE